MYLFSCFVRTWRYASVRIVAHVGGELRNPCETPRHLGPFLAVSLNLELDSRLTKRVKKALKIGWNECPKNILKIKVSLGILGCQMKSSIGNRRKTCLRE